MWNGFCGLFFLFFILLFSQLILLYPPFLSKTRAAEVVKKTQAIKGKPQEDKLGRKTGGIMGDPAHKRGVELGFDAGLKAAKEDQAQGKKPNPSSRREYQKPDAYYRYEYGSLANFLSGFRAGFLGGYKGIFGKKVSVSAAETHPSSSHPAPLVHPASLKEGSKTHRPSPRKFNPAEDAL